MWPGHTLSARNGVPATIVQHQGRRIYLGAMTDAPTSAEDVRTIVSERGIEFLFAQFVDMHGKPSAKLVPAHHIDDLLSDPTVANVYRGRHPTYYGAPDIPHDGFLADVLMRNKGFIRD